MSGLHAVSVSCVGRSANSVAHSLARFARGVEDEFIWLEESPHQRWKLCILIHYNEISMISLSKKCFRRAHMKRRHLTGRHSHTIDSTFLPFEAEQIKSIPLGIVKQSDLLYWPWSRDESYSVSTGYQRLCAEEQKDSASPSNLDKTHGFWKKLWKAGVPGKLKHFEWKACS